MRLTLLLLIFSLTLIFLIAQTQSPKVLTSNPLS
ncbi:MAG: hypothetical protein ACI956_001759, partial [Nonlabens sp.]